MNTLDRYSSTIGLLIVIGTFAAAALVAAAGRLPEPIPVQPTPPLPILYLPTSVPVPTPTPDTAMQQENEQLKARVAELEAQRSARRAGSLPANGARVIPDSGLRCAHNRWRYCDPA